MTLRKKHLLICILLLTAMSLLYGVVGVRAQEAVEVRFDPQQAQASVGATTTVHLLVKAEVAVGGFDLTLDYDPDLLLLDGWAYGDFLSELYVLKKEDTPGHFRLVSVQLAIPPVAGEGTLVELTLRGLAVGTSTLMLSDVTLANATGNQYVAGVTNGSVSVVMASTNTPTSKVTATSTPSTPYPLLATATRTRTPILTQPGVIFPTATQRANLTITAQVRLTATIQPTNTTVATELQNPIAPIPTPSNHPGSGTPTPSVSGITTDPFVIPIRPISTLNVQQIEDKFASKSILIFGIILFDVVALAFVVYLIWKRRRKDDEGNS